MVLKKSYKINKISLVYEQEKNKSRRNKGNSRKADANKNFRHFRDFCGTKKIYKIKIYKINKISLACEQEKNKSRRNKGNSRKATAKKNLR